jgi:hypothetical protein
MAPALDPPFICRTNEEHVGAKHRWRTPTLKRRPSQISGEAIYLCDKVFMPYMTMGVEIGA